MCWQLLHPDHFVLSFANTPFQDGPSAEARMKQTEAGDLRVLPAPQSSEAGEQGSVSPG